MNRVGEFEGWLREHSVAEFDDSGTVSLLNSGVLIGFDNRGASVNVDSMGPGDDLELEGPGVGLECHAILRGESSKSSSFSAVEW